MPDVIQLLPDSIANQIAAGEVVQRPASAVKELLENAIDAGCTSVKLIIKDAGKTLIQVIDDGSGMSETDARMSLERHATSKIRKAEDLFTLRTMGFRGEALASIAAVSQLEMRTRLADRELGTLLVVEATEVKKQEPVACDKGTSISVKNLFFNIPARRNFLKSNPVELKHVVDEFQRLALAYPSVAFSMIQGDELVYELPAAKISQRIINLFGRSYQGQLVACREETELVRVSGYVGKPEFARKTRGEQFLFVNNRFIRSNYLNHAVMNAFEGLLPENSYPFYVLFIELDPKHIDVNVHPTKTEIKFDDERAVYAVVRSAVRQALGTHSLSPSIDFKDDVNILNKLGTSGQSKEVYFEERFQPSGLRSSGEWQKLFETEFPHSRLLKSEKTEGLFVESVASNEPPEAGTGFQLLNRYIVQPVTQGLLFIDQQAAHERILYERFMMRLQARSGESQQSLFPQAVTLSPADFALITEMTPEIVALGFRFEPFGKNTLQILGIPAGLQPGREKELVEGLLDQFKSNQAELSLPLGENLARSLARRASVKAGEKLEPAQIKAIAGQLFSCTMPNYTPDGRSVWLILDLAKIETYFNHT
jgi:DNA mismatch repair protein MutL